jgi:glycerol-3-phosphate acyltransferase PlsX
MMKVALDAMGGDAAPQAAIEGAVQAAIDNRDRFEILLAGPQDTIQAELDRLGYSGEGLHIVHAPELVAMDESPTSVLKNKQNSGLVTCVALQKQGLAAASVSAGNSGAMMAACLMILGRIGRISRPAIACNVPAVDRLVVLMDCGANVDEKPSTLLDFAICGSVYAEHVLEYSNPSIGLLNVGEEEKKGPEVIQEAHQLLKNSNLNFHGNIEGRDILSGTTDVIVAPGYAGNIVLKLMEGFYELHKNTFGIINSETGRKFDEQWDYRNHGGGLLLGLNGTGIITHGRADAKAIKISLETAYRFAQKGVSQKIAEKLIGTN